LEEWEQSSILAALQRLATMMDAADLPAAAVLDAGASPNPTRMEHDD
jgi:hypothetical protein